MDTSTKKLSKDNPYYAKIEEEMKKRGARTGEEREKFYKDKVYNNKKNVDVRKDTKEIAPLSGYSHSFDDVKAAPKKDINITDKIKSVSPNSGYAQRFKEDNTNKKAASLSDKIRSVSPVSPAGQKINLNKNPDRLRELQAKKAANDTKKAADEARKFLQADNSVSQYELFNRMNNLTSDDVNRLLQSEEQRNKELKNSRTKLMYDRVGVTADKKKLLDNDLSESDARIQQYRIWLNENDLRQKAEEVKAKYSGLQNEPDYWERSSKAEKKLPYFRSEANDIYEYYVSRFSPETNKYDKYKNINLETDNAGKFLTHATPDEMRNYIYLYNKKGEKAAKEYYDMLEPDLRKRSANAEMERAEKRGKEHPYISTAETIASYVPVSTVGGAAVAKSAITGKVDPYDPLYVAGAAREAEREATTNLIQNDTLRLTYSAVTSAADNAVAALTVGKAVSAFGGAGMSAAAKAAWTGRITGGIMSSGVAANSVLEAKKEGFSDTSAIAVGIARGSIEYLSEKFSIERIMKEPTTVLKALKKSVVSEGSEEVVSNWANRLVDNIINMGLTKEYNELVESGMSEKEAFLTVAEKAAYEDLESFMGGAIAGSFMTAGHLGVQTAQVGGVKNMNRVLEYQSELAQMPEEERERIIKQNEERYNKERAVEILTRDNLNMGDIAGALNFLGVSDPQQAAKDIEHFKETGETSDLMKDKNVSSVVEVLATEGYFKKNTDKNTVNEQSQSFDNEVFENESGIELHKDFEDFPYNQKKVLKDYINSVNEEVVKSVNEVKQNKNIPFKRFTLGTVTDRAANKIKELTGYNVQGYTYAINSNALKHIEKRHGENGIHDKSMANAEDVSRVGYVIDNYDNMELLTDKHGNAIYSREFRGKDGNSAPMFLYTKKINGTYYSAVATAENKYKKLWVVSAYISKNKEGITQVLHDELSSLVSTSDNGLASLSSDTSITQQTENVKSDSNVQERNNKEVPPINVKADPMHGVNEDAVKVITDGIGSEGRKAYYNVLERESESAYQGSEATLLRDFNRFYIKGLNGGKLSEVSGKYAKVMTERSMTEAFKAGQSDRGAMLKEKFKAVNNAVIRDGGLIRNVNSENLTNEEISQIDNLGKKFGVSIEIQDHVYNNTNKEVNGVYEAGSIILNQSKMEEFGNVKAAEGFLVKHELTHRVRELAPKGFETLKSVVYDIEDRKSGNTSKAETVMTQRGVDVDTAIEEIVADHMGNEDFALEVAMKDLSLAERIKGWVSDILDRVGIKKYSETQRIKRLWEKACAEAKRTVKNADKRVGNDVKATGNAKYSDKMDFKHQVDASLDGKLQRGLSIYVGKTPNLLQKCGLDDLVMLINQAHLKNITAEKDSDNHKHGLTREQIKQLPNELKHPVMVYDSISDTNKNCICVVTSLKDVDNLPIIAVIKANSNETNKYLDISLKTITTKDSNYILSAYGRANFENHLNEVINKNAVLYVNKEKTSKLISDSGLQLPTRYNSLRFDTIIHRSNNIVNTSGQNNQKNSDGNLSEVMSENKRLRKENEKLKELKDHYKGQMLRTPNLYSPSGINIKKIINRVAIGYTGDKKALTLQLKQAQELLSKCISVSLKADPKYTNELYGRYREHLSLIAGDIVNNTRTKNDQIYEQYRHIKDSLKGVTIKVDESWKNDLNGVDGYNDFRKKNFGVVKMSLVNGTPVDVLYSELGAKFGELFPEDITTEPEQLIHITETVRAMSNFYENPYNSDMDSVIEGIADTLDLELLTLSSERTQADKYFDEAQKQIETAMEERDKAVRKIQDKYNRKIEEFKEEQRQKRENSAKRKEEATTRQKLLTLARRMKRIANNGRTTPANQALIQELIGHIDTIAVSMTGATVKNLQNLSKWYKNAAERINFVPNPRIEEDLARLDNEKIGEMNFERVMTLITALENIEKQIENENIEIGKKGDVYEKGMATIEHINNSGGSVAYGLNNAKDAIVTGLSNPVNEIHRLTGYADDDALYQTTKDIRKSELVEVYHEMKANKLFEEYTKDKKFMKHLREDFKTFTVKQYDALGNETGEKEIRLNPAMIISLAQLAKNSGSLLHMTEGGVRIADEKIYKHGKIKEAYDRGTVVKMVSPEIRKITSTLNETDRAYMRKVEKYFNEFAKNEINAVSQQLDGIDRARVGFYYPMNTDSSFLVKEFDTISYDASVENQGSLKERVRNAKNPLLLMAAPDVVSRAISNNGKYIAYAIPLRNFKKLWNTMTRGDLVQVPETDKYKNVKLDENGDVIMKNVYKNNFEGSVKDSVERVWGHRAVEYVENFIKDIETGRSDKTGGATKVLNFFHGNYVKAVLTLNLPVAINQVASFPSAAPVLGWKPLLMSLKDLGKVDLELISQYTGAQWNRTKGAYDLTIADAYTDNKALPKILDWMMASDSIITRKLWKASEYYVRIHKPGLEIGTHEYYRAVADIYETTMQETQPNSGVMERPAVLRADSATRLLMPFTGEPLKNVNLLYDAFGNMAAKKKQLDRVAGTQLQAEAEKRLKEAKKNLKTTIVSQVLASAAYTVFVALARIAFGGKNGRKKYEDEEGNLTAASILKAMGKDFLITSLTQIPFTSDLVDFIAAIIKGEKYYAPELISLQALTDATEACINTASLISDFIKGDGGTWQQTIEKINNSAIKVSTLVGIPLKNIENIANSLMYWGSKTVFYNNPTMQKYAVAKFSGTLVEKKKNKKTGEIEYTATAEAKKILYNAFVNGETDNYENILFDLVDSGVKASDLESAMRNLSQNDDNFAFDKSLGAFAGVKDGEDYEKYENYMKRAEKAEVSEEDLKKGIDIIDSGKPYKEMYTEITSFTKNMGEKQKTFFDDIARGKYSANELNKEQYKSYSKTRKEITETLEKQFDKTGLKNKEINDVQNKIYQYAEKTALENASNGEYRIDSEWIKQAGKSESTIGVNTAEFIKLYNKYGEKVYSEQSVITHEVGYNVNVSLEYSRLKSVKGTESERDENGEIIKGKSKQDKIIAIIDGMDITDSEKAYLFSIDYKANNNNPWAGSQKVNYKKYLEQRKD